LLFVLHSFHQTAAALFTSTSAFFARDNVALPGVAFYFKVKLQLPLKQCMHADFLERRYLFNPAISCEIMHHGSKNIG
jgi:hypothetical protein